VTFPAPLGPLGVVKVKGGLGGVALGANRRDLSALRGGCTCRALANSFANVALPLIRRFAPPCNSDLCYDEPIP
jgi:hypothetical protein